MCKSFVLYVLVWWSVPCFVFVVVAAQNPLLIFVSYLSISYVLQQRPFFMLDLFSPVDEIRFRVLFSFWLCDCVCVSILRNFMSLFSHFVGDYLSISASIRRILNSEDNKWRIFVVFVVVHSHEFQSNILLSNEMTLFLTVIDQYRTKDKISIYLCRMSILLIRTNVYTSFSHDMHHLSGFFLLLVCLLIHTMFAGCYKTINFP